MQSGGAGTAMWTWRIGARVGGRAASALQMSTTSPLCSHLRAWRMRRTVGYACAACCSPCTCCGLELLHAFTAFAVLRCQCMDHCEKRGARIQPKNAVTAVCILLHCLCRRPQSCMHRVHCIMYQIGAWQQLSKHASLSGNQRFDQAMFVIVSRTLNFNQGVRVCNSAMGVAGGADSCMVGRSHQPPPHPPRERLERGAHGHLAWGG